MNPATLTTFCARATPETLRRNPVTAPYEGTFFNVAKRNGLLHARAWLLGRILLDNHVKTNPTPLPLHQHLDPPPAHHNAPRTPRDRLQQHIESAATHVDTTPAFL